MDGTFEYLSKTMNDREGEAELDCMHVIWGEYGHILSWAFGENESDECYQRLLYFLRQRCERLGLEHVQAVKAAYSDTCCQGLKDPTTHWITQVFPNVPRAPYRDNFHAMKKVTDATQPHHELKLPFTQYMKGAFTHYDEQSKNHVAGLYMKKCKHTVSHEVAKEQMLKRKEYVKKVKKLNPDKAVIKQRVEEAWTKISLEDQGLKARAELNGEGYLPFILSAKKGVRLGTRKEIDNLLVHIEKGCCDNPFDLDGMNVALDPDDEYPDYQRKQGTLQGESTNRQFNRMTDDVGRQSAETADKRMWLRVSRFNQSKDQILQKVLKLTKVRTVEWYLHEALLKENSALSLYHGYDFPPELPEGYFEPIGVEYGWYSDWSRVEIEINRWMELSACEGSADPFDPANTVAQVGPGAAEVFQEAAQDLRELAALNSVGPTPGIPAVSSTA